MDPSMIGRIAVTFAVFVASLGFVTWRQSRAFEAHVELDELRRRTAVAQAERIDLERSIQVLLSRSHVVPVATERLGMHMPDGSEQIIHRAEEGS